MKEAAKTLVFLKENGIDSYDDLVKKSSSASGDFSTLTKKIKDAEKRMADISELQTRNERMFLVTIIVLNTANAKRDLENTVFAAAGIAQKHNCALKRLDWQQEQGLMSSLPIGLNQIEIQRDLSASEVSSKNLSEEKNKIKELIADISHQTKTPIANILIYSQLLREQSLPEQSRTCVAELNSQAEKLSFLISSLVKISRLEAGIRTFNPKKSGIQPMLDNVAEQITLNANEKKLLYL